MLLAMREQVGGFHRDTSGGTPMAVRKLALHRALDLIRFVTGSWMHLELGA